MPASATESELSALLRRHGRFVLLGAIFGVALAAMAVLFLPEVHRASAMILLEGDATEREATQQLATVQMQSWEFLEGIGEDPQAIREQITVKATRENAFLRVSAEAATPDAAADLANEVAETWVAEFSGEGPQLFDVELKNRIDKQAAIVAGLAERHDPEHPVLKVEQAQLAKLRRQAAEKQLNKLLAHPAEAAPNRVAPAILPTLFAGLAIGAFLGGAVSVLRRR